MKATHPIITALIAHVIAELTPVNAEQRFDAILDECYSFDKVGGPFSGMSPSRVLRECDPTAHRCGVNDYMDGEEVTEVDGEYYDNDKLAEAKAEFVSAKEREISEQEAEITELERQKELAETTADHDENQAEMNEATDKLAALNAELSALEAHTF